MVAEGGYSAVVVDSPIARKVVIFAGPRIIGSRVHTDREATDWLLVERTVLAVTSRTIARRWRNPDDPKVWTLHLTVGS
jgi:hypothetical protein